MLKDVSFSMEEGNALCHNRPIGLRKDYAVTVSQFPLRDLTGQIIANAETLLMLLKRARIRTSRAAKEAAFGMVFQQFNLFHSTQHSENVTWQSAFWHKRTPELLG